MSRKETSQNKEARRALYNNVQPEEMNKLLFLDLGFNAFSTDVFKKGQKIRNYSSLEGQHNGIHGWTGGGGHMSYPECAAFDPIFWLHHWYVSFSFTLPYLNDRESVGLS
jgi:tyrosinase